MENTSKKGFYLILEDNKYALIPADIAEINASEILVYCSETKDIAYTMLHRSCKLVEAAKNTVSAIKDEIALSRDFPVVSDTLGLILSSPMGKELIRAIAASPL